MATDTKQPGTALATAPAIGQLARREYAREQIDLIKATVASGATDAELDLFLELCARYQLDPFAGQVFCARMRGTDGEGGKMVTMVGRDGMLLIARRYDDFEGLLGDYVCEHDEFRTVNRDDDVLVTHVYGKPSERGEVVGAWAKVKRRGFMPTYFFARLEDYKPTHSKVNKTPWGPQEATMILKCAQSTALRFAFSITGLVGAEEVSRFVGPAEQVDASDAEWGDDPVLAERLAELFAAANATVSDSYRPRKIQAMLAGKSEGERRQIALDLESFIEANGGEVPPVPADSTVDDPNEEIEEAEFTTVEPDRQEPLPDE
jgi:phage recombination protein Bet